MSLEMKVENIIYQLYKEDNNIRLKSETEEILFVNQTAEKISEIIEQNFNLVSRYFKSNLSNTISKIELKDINSISFSIVLHYFYMYNNWKNTYKNQEKINLIFNNDDFNNSSTYDIVFKYFKDKYPKEWKVNACSLLKITNDELERRNKERENFYEK